MTGDPESGVSGMTVLDEMLDSVQRAGPRHREPMVYDSEEYARRGRYISEYGFAVPNARALRLIAAHVGDRKLLEAGAGTGLWARLLAELGITVTAVDNRVGCYNNQFEVGRYYDVLCEGGLLAIAKRPDHEALMLCWPDMSPMAAECLAAFTGDRLVYIGESAYGCNASAAFFNALERDWDVCEHAIPQWPGLRDYLVLAKRKAR